MGCDVTLYLYADIYYQEQFVATIQFNEIVPAIGRLRVEPRAEFDKEIIVILENDSPARFKYNGTYSVSGKYLYITFRKTWDNSWEQEIEYYKIYPSARVII
jgi:hypothetical protein